MKEELKKTLLSLAYNHATDSPDKSNQNGAVVYNEESDIIIGVGCNKFLPNTVITDELVNNREKKLFYIEHSERNAIFSAVRSEYSHLVNGSTMVCPWFACADCARAIVLNGIKRVIGHKQRMEQTPERWKASVDAGLDLMRLHDVELEFWEGELGCNKIIVNGELWQP